MYTHPKNSPGFLKLLVTLLIGLNPAMPWANAEEPPVKPSRDTPAQTAAAKVTIQKRKVWSQSDAMPSGLTPHTGGKITNIVIHHTETPNQPEESAPKRIASIHDYHTKSRGWKDIAYHYFIAPDGTIYEGRDERFQTDTGAAYPLDGTLTVTLIGDFRGTLPTAEALASLTAFLQEKVAAHSLAPSAVSTHGARAGGKTDCPGSKLQAWLDQTAKGKLAN